MAISDEQQKFLEQLALRIPRLFEAIRSGNIKSEYIVGVRRVGDRQVRLKLVAEVVDPGANPLKTHGMIAPVQLVVHAEVLPDSSIGQGGSSQMFTEASQLDNQSEKPEDSDQEGRS